MDKFILDGLVNFAEEHWQAFIGRCKELGITEAEVEQEFDKYKEKK